MTATTTFEIRGRTTPARLLETIRRQAPHLLDEAPPAGAPKAERPAAEAKRPAAQARRPEVELLLTPAEVAALFRVDPKTVTRWAKTGKLTSVRTPGGHRRFRETEVRALLAGIPVEAAG